MHQIHSIRTLQHVATGPTRRDHRHLLIMKHVYPPRPWSRRYQQCNISVATRKPTPRICSEPFDNPVMQKSGEVARTSVAHEGGWGRVQLTLNLNVRITLMGCFLLGNTTSPDVELVIAVAGQDILVIIWGFSPLINAPKIPYTSEAR